MRRIGVGIIGLGNAVKPHAAALRALAERVTVVGGFSPSPARRAHFATTYGLPAVESLDALLADARVEALLVLTPPRTHAELALAAARAGIEVDRNLPILWFRAMDSANSLGRRDVWDDTGAHLREIAPSFYYSQAALNDYDLLRGDFSRAREKFEAGFKASPAEYGYPLVMIKWVMRDPAVDDATIRASVASDQGAVWWAGFRGDADLFFAGLSLPFIPGKSSLYTNFTPIPLRRYLADPRAKKLLREWGFEAYWRVKGWPALCRPLGESDFGCGPGK